MAIVTYTSPGEKWLLSLALGIKQQLHSVEKSDRAELRFDNGQVEGLSACILAIEALKPEPSLFPNGNIGMPVALIHWFQSLTAQTSASSANILANAELIMRQMHDGRPFLQGKLPGLADIVSAAWLIPQREHLPADHSALPWIERMERLANSLHHSEGLSLDVEAFKELQGDGLLKVQMTDTTVIVTSPLDH